MVGTHEHVHLLPQPADQGLESGQPLQRRECVHGRVLLPPRRISRTTGWIESGWAARKSPNSTSRSATHGPW